jgi:hypothetical protein
MIEDGARHGRGRRHSRLPPFAKNAKERGTHRAGNAREIKSLGHPPLRNNDRRLFREVGKQQGTAGTFSVFSDGTLGNSICPEARTIKKVRLPPLNGASGPKPESLPQFLRARSTSSCARSRRFCIFTCSPSQCLRFLPRWSGVRPMSSVALSVSFTSSGPASFHSLST